MSRHVDGPCKGRANNSEQLTQPDPKPAGINMVSPCRVCCVCPVSFLHPSVRPRSTVRRSLSCSLFLGRVILNACFDTISGRVNNALCCSRDAWSRVWIRSVVVLAKDTVDGQIARKLTLLKETSVEDSKVLIALTASHCTSRLFLSVSAFF